MCKACKAGALEVPPKSVHCSVMPMRPAQLHAGAALPCSYLYTASPAGIDCCQGLHAYVCCQHNCARQVSRRQVIHTLHYLHASRRSERCPRLGVCNRCARKFVFLLVCTNHHSSLPWLLPYRHALLDATLGPTFRTAAHTLCTGVYVHCQRQGQLLGVCHTRLCSLVAPCCAE